MDRTPIDEFVEQTFRSLEYERKALMLQMREIKDRMESRMNRLENWAPAVMKDGALPLLPISDLGELQAQGPALDVQCGRLNARWQEYRDALVLQAKMRSPDEHGSSR